METEAAKHDRCRSRRMGDEDGGMRLPGRSQGRPIRGAAMLWRELDDPPDPEELLAWAKTRAFGRARFLWRAVLVGFLYGLSIWLGSTMIYVWITGDPFSKALGKGLGY